MSIIDPPYINQLRVFNLIDIHRGSHLFVKRPPYQRKNVWAHNKKEALIDSFFRRHYVPDIILREIKTPDNKHKWEVVDGQQRINTIQEFFTNQFRLPKTLLDITKEAGNYYKDLRDEVKKHIEIQRLQSTVLMALTDPIKRKIKNLWLMFFGDYNKENHYPILRWNIQNYTVLLGTLLPLTQIILVLILINMNLAILIHHATIFSQLLIRITPDCNTWLY